MRTLIENGTIVYPEREKTDKRNLLIRDGVIQGFPNDEESASLKSQLQVRVVDASGLMVVPGFIDMHVHLREPGEEYKETLNSGSLAAVAGGFTAVACMPNTNPPNDCAAVTGYIVAKARSEAKCRIYPVASITVGIKGERLTEFGDIIDAGAVAFSDDGKPVSDSDLMRRALEYAKVFGVPIISHAEDLGLSAGGAMHEGTVSTRLGLPGIPSAAEDVAVFRDVAIAGLTHGRVHIAHVSTEGAVEIIRAAKARGINVTAETAPHYFTLTHEAVEGYRTEAKMNPPLRTARDVEAVREGLRDGTIDVIATDHAPHSVLEKEVEFDLASFGIVGLETSFGLTMELVRENVLTFSKALQKLSTNPARLLHVQGGCLKEGQPADLVLIDVEKEYQVDAASFKSKGRNTPFHGRRLKGMVVKTIVNGEVVMQAGM